MDALMTAVYVVYMRTYAERIKAVSCKQIDWKDFKSEYQRFYYIYLKT